MGRKNTQACVNNKKCFPSVLFNFNPAKHVGHVGQPRKEFEENSVENLSNIPTAPPPTPLLNTTERYSVEIQGVAIVW